MRVLQIGNFEPPHSTENHLRRALVNNGHEVTPLQENQERLFPDILNAKYGGPQKHDFILWTRTGWDYTRHGYKSQEEALMYQSMLVNRARAWGVPTVAYHLDLWHGLNREHQLDEPFFQCDLVVTADGGHEEDFAKRGINHVWFPPAVSEGECVIGNPREEFISKLAFVGNWRGDYHKEHQHRFELVRWLQQNYRRDCAFYPIEGQPAVRGKDLQDLYASVDVVIGDSCFAGKIKNYWSDRVPETLGRGGFLVHPNIPGLEEHFQLGIWDFAWPSAQMFAWDVDHWDDLANNIEWALRFPDERRKVAANGRAHVLEHHTYEVRMRQLVDLMQERKVL